MVWLGWLIWLACCLACLPNFGWILGFRAWRGWLGWLIDIGSVCFGSGGGFGGRLPGGAGGGRFLAPGCSNCGAFILAWGLGWAGLGWAGQIARIYYVYK